MFHQLLDRIFEPALSMRFADSDLETDSDGEIEELEEPGAATVEASGETGSTEIGGGKPSINKEKQDSV